MEASGHKCMLPDECFAKLNGIMKEIFMQELIINVTQIEELQTLKNLMELDHIFAKAKSAIVNGEKVVLVRKTATQPAQKFDEFSTLQELQQYKELVFKYLW